MVEFRFFQFTSLRYCVVMIGVIGMQALCDPIGAGFGYSNSAQSVTLYLVKFFQPGQNFLTLIGVQ